MALSQKKKPLGHRHCQFSGCKVLFQPTSKRQRYHTSKCRFADWMQGRNRTIVTRLAIDEQSEPTLWYAVTANPEDFPLALFRNAADAIEYGKTRARAKHQIVRVELRLANPSKSRQ